MTALSVIIPAYNRTMQLYRAVRSVARQRLQCELLIVDDASNPPIYIDPQIAKPASLRLFRHATNLGAAAARNTGMRAAKGKWIAFLDSDDEWLPQTLGIRLQAAMQDAKGLRDRPIIWSAGFREVDNETGCTKTRIPVGAENLFDFASGCWYASGSTALFPKRIIHQIGYQDENLRRLEDFDWFIRLGLAHGQLRVFPDTVAIIYRQLDDRRNADARHAITVLRQRRYVSVGNIHAFQFYRRLWSYLALEYAATLWHERRYIAFAAQAAKSLALVPRVRLHLKNFWISNEESAELLTTSPLPETKAQVKPAYKRHSQRWLKNSFGTSVRAYFLRRGASKAVRKSPTEGLEN